MFKTIIPKVYTTVSEAIYHISIPYLAIFCNTCIKISSLFKYSHDISLLFKKINFTLKPDNSFKSSAYLRFT